MFTFLAILEQDFKITIAWFKQQGKNHYKI